MFVTKRISNNVSGDIWVQINSTNEYIIEFDSSHSIYTIECINASKFDKLNEINENSSINLLPKINSIGMYVYVRLCIYYVCSFIHKYICLYVLNNNCIYRKQ